jgi:hypothetical protein
MRANGSSSDARDGFIFSIERLFFDTGLKIFIAFCLVITGGCGAYREKFDEGQQLPDQTTSITVGRTERLAVRNIFGKPAVTSDYLKLDIFRSEASSQIEIPIVLLPAGLLWDNIYRYTLVAYDDSNIVIAIDSGLYRSSGWRQPLERSYLDLKLYVGKYQLRIDEKDDQVIILADPELLNTYINLPQKGNKCLIVLGCQFEGMNMLEQPDICRTDLSFDGGATFYLPSRPYTNEETAITPEKMIKSAGQNIPFRTPIAVFQIPSGEHTLDVSTAYPPFKGGHSTAFSCQQNKITSVVIKPIKSLSSTHVQWVFDFKQEVPETFFDRKIVLYTEGKWLVEPVAND